MAVTITRGELSATGLRREAARSRDANAVRRMLAIALVLDGRSREDAAGAVRPSGRFVACPPGGPPTASRARAACALA